LSGQSCLASAWIGWIRWSTGKCYVLTVVYGREPVAELHENKCRVHL
jgi:hypothetical protein